MAKNSQVNVGIKFKSDTKEVENSLSKLKQSLTEISNINITNFSGKEQDLKQIQKTAKQVKNALEQAFNPTLNTINIESFYNSLKKSNITIKQVYTSFSQLGATGEIAFANLTKEIFGTNLKLKQTHSLLDSMSKTMVNTVKWGIASSVMNTFTQSVQGAFQYVQSLEKSLTNIRIVTGDSTEKMAQFAEQANRSAQALGRSTLDYTKASLTFYQQGLNEEDVQARTEATLKAQNITGAGSQMADYLTSVWNGYKVANEEAELYVDKLAAVADSSASDMSQLAIAMSKVASTANTMGVDVDQLNAQIATVVATTRQAPESVGTAFKTIYTRMNDIKTGSDEAEISLGRYSGKMAELGFNVLDATGHLRDTGQVMEEIGGRWQDLTREQQIYLAQTMGGQRQVNQLMALFDNWTTYSELLNTSLESEGTLAEKNSRYMESLGAKMEQLGAAGERVKNALINEDDLKGGVTALTNLINLFGSFIESMGGGTNILIGFGGILAQIAAPAIASELNNIAENAKRTEENLNLVAEAANKIKEKGSEWQELDAKTNKKMSSGYLDRANQLNELYQNHGLDEKTFNEQQERSNRILSLQEEALQLEETKKSAEQYYQAFSNGQKIEESSSGGQKRRIELLKNEAKAIEQIAQSLQTIDFSNGKDELIKFEKEIDNLIQKFGDNVPESLQNLKSQIESALTTWNTTQGDVNSQEWTQAFFELSDAAQTVSNELNYAAGSIQNYSQNANNLIIINDELNKTLEDFNNVNESAIRKVSYQSLVKMAGGFAQVISGVNGLVNITKIWNNENLSMGEKIRQITMSSITSIGMLTKGFSRVKKEIKILTSNLTLLAAQHSAEGLAAQAAAVAQAKAAGASQAEALSAGKAALAEYAHGMALKEVASSLLLAYGYLIPVVAILGTLGLTIYAVCKAYNQAADAAKQAAENAKSAKKQYDEMKDSFKNLTSAIEDYDNAKKALSELTKGTEQWYDKVNELNDKVLQLIQNFPELAKYVKTDENGVLYFEGEGEEEEKKVYRQRAYVSGMANASAQEKSYQANRTAEIVEQGRRIYGFGGQDVMEAVVSAVQKNGTSILADEDRLIKAIADEGVILNQDQIDATRENTQQIRILVDSLNAEKTEVNALRDSLIKTNLNNEEEYRNSTHKDAFANIVAGLIEQGKQNGLDEFYKKEEVSYGYGNNQKTTQVRFDRDAAIKKYEELTGREVNEKNGKFSVRQAGTDDQFEEIKFSDITNYLREASIDMEKIVADATERMAAAQENFANASDRTKEILFDSGLSSGFNGVNAKQFSKEDINNLRDLNQTNLANYLGVSQEDLEENFTSLEAQVEQEVNDFIQGVGDINVKGTLLEVQSKNSDLSEELAEYIAQQVQDGLNVDKEIENDDQKVIGKEIWDFYESISDNEIEEATKVAETFDFASGSAQDFRNALTEAGVTSSEISQEVINNYINAKKRILNEQAEDNRVNSSKIAEGSSTLGLVQKQANGENLSQKQIESLEAGLNNLLQIYPKLTKQIQTLKEASLVGTSSYEEALRKLKMALVESYQDMAAAGTISLEEISQQMSGYIKTSEDLQMVQNAGIFTFQDYSQKLKLIANQYDSCKNELQEYILALQSHNDEVAAATAQFNLELALRSAENGEKYGIEAERISDLANRYVELANQGVQAYEGLNRNAELAADAATRYIRLNDSIENLQKNFTAVSEVLDALSVNGLEEVLGDTDYAKTFEQIKENVAGILNVSQELVDADFIKEYAQQIKEAANGSQEAVEALQEAFAEDIIANVKIDDQKFYDTLGQTKEQFANWLNDLPEGEINLDENPAIQSLVTLLEQAGYSKEQIEDLFSGANIDLDLGYPDTSGVVDAVNDATDIMAQGGANASDAYAENAGVDVTEKTETSEQTDNVEAAGVEATLTPQQADVSFPRVAAMAIPGVGFLPQLDGTVPGHMTYYGVNVEPKVKEEQATKTNTAVGLEVKGATKSSGGKVSHKNSSGGNKKAGKGGGGKGGKGGGGGKAKEPNKAKGATNKADRYRNNTVKANKLANSMTKLQKQQERLTGKDSLKNLQKQLQILKKQNETIGERIRLQRDEQKQLANNLKKSGATFDKDGTLNNYFKVHANIMKKYNDAVAKWNKMSADQQQKNKEYLNNAKTEMDNALKDLQRYDKLQQEIAKSIQQQIDNAQAQIDLKAKQFELKIKAELDLSEAKRDWNKFRRDLIDEVRDDDILGLNKYRFADISSYFNNIGTGSIQYLTDRLKELTGTPDGSGIFSADYLNETLKNMTVTDRQARLEQIKKVMDDLQGQMKDFKSLADDIKKSIFDTIDATQDAFDQQMDEYEYVGDLINHNMKVTELLFGDQAYDRMTKYYDRIEENNNNQLDFLTKEKDLWYSRMIEEQARIAQLNPNTNAYKQAEDRFKQYQKHWMDSVNDLNDKIEDALDNIIDKYANAISNIFLNFDLSLGGGRALDDISDEWDMLNDLADTYLDKINSAYEIEKLQNAFDDAIDDNEGNIAAQQSLNNLMEQQLAYLKDKEKLTQYDVDRANTLLQIEMKRLALEQSRNNKNRLRLRRDSQGNYTYQYTADTEAMNKAEQELADARNSLYNSDKAAYVDNLSAIQKSANDIKDKLEDIWKDENLSKEQKLQKSYELQKYYGQKINDLIAENASIRNNLMDSAFEELAKMYGISEDEFRAMSKEQQDAIFKDLIPQANSYAAQMVENIAGAGGMATFFQNLLGPLVQSYDNRVASIAEIEEKSKTNFENIVNDTDILISQAEQLLDNNDKLVGSQEEQLNLLQSQLNVVSQMLQKYEAYKSAISDAVESGYNELNDANASIVGTTRAKEDAVAAAQMKQLENGMNAASSAWDIKDYTPYTPQWSGSDFAALFGSANIIPLTQQSGKVIQELGDVVPTLSNLNTNTLFGTIDNNIFNSINNILNNILETSQEYYATSLAKQDAIKQAVVANQTIHIDADFPNAKDVRNIIEAIEGLANAAAQRANTKGI